MIRIAMLLCISLLFPIACDQDGHSISLGITFALQDIPEGTLREIPLRFGEDIVSSKSDHMDELVSTKFYIATIRRSHWGNSWYLLAHSPGVCQLNALRNGEVVATFDVNVVAQ